MTWDITNWCWKLHFKSQKNEFLPKNQDFTHNHVRICTSARTAFDDWPCKSSRSMYHNYPKAILPVCYILCSICAHNMLQHILGSIPTLARKTQLCNDLTTIVPTFICIGKAYAYCWLSSKDFMRILLFLLVICAFWRAWLDSFSMCCYHNFHIFIKEHVLICVHSM